MGFNSSFGFTLNILQIFQDLLSLIDPYYLYPRDQVDVVQSRNDGKVLTSRRFPAV